MKTRKSEKLSYARLACFQTIRVLGMSFLILLMLNISYKETREMKRAFKILNCKKQEKYQSSTFERALTNPLIKNVTLKSTEHIIHWYNFCLDRDEHWLWIQSHKLQNNLCVFHCYESSYASKRPEVRMWSLLKSHHYNELQRSIHHLPTNGTSLTVQTKNPPCLFQYPLFIARHNHHLPHFLEELLAAYSLISNTEFMPEMQLVSKLKIVFVAFPNISEKLLLNPLTWHGHVVLIVKETVQRYFGIEVVIKGRETFSRLYKDLKCPFLCFQHVFYNTRAAQRPESYTHWLYSNGTGKRLQNVIQKRLQSRHFGGLHTRTSPRIIMVQRNTTRRICQAEKIVQILESTYGVKIPIVLFEHLSFLQQAQLMHKASMVIAAHGASLSNIIFMKRGSVLIELSPYLCSGEGYFGALARLLGLHYFHLSGMRREGDQSNQTLPRNGCSRVYRDADIHVPMEQLLQIVSAAIRHI